MSAQPQAKEVLSHLLPWSSKVFWWVVLIEGIVIAGFGLFMVLFPQAGLITVSIGVYLLVEGILTFIRVLRQNPLDRAATAQLMRGMASFAVGLVIFVPRVLVSLIITSAQTRSFNPIMVLDPTQTPFRLFMAVAATGAALVGVLRFWEATQRRTNEGRIGSALVGLIFLGLAGIGFVTAIGNMNSGFSIGLFALIIGTILIVYAIILRLRTGIGSGSGGKQKAKKGKPAVPDALQEPLVADASVDQPTVDQTRPEAGVESGPQSS